MTHGSPQLAATLSGSFPPTAVPFNVFVAPGLTGWMTLHADSDSGLVGALLNFNAAAADDDDGYTGGRNLHHLTLTSAATLTFPVFPPAC